MKKILLILLAMFAFSIASFAGTVSTQCTFAGFTPNTTATFVNATQGSPQTATCAGATALGIDGVNNILTQVTIFIESDYQNCGDFANPCTSADVRLTYTPSVTAGTNWSATSGTFCAANQACEDVKGQVSSSSYQINQTGTTITTNAFIAAAIDTAGLAGFNGTWTESVGSSLQSVLPAGQAPVTSSAQVAVTYTYSTSVTSSSPEPVSMLLFGSGLVAVSLFGRKKLSRR